MPGTTEAQVDDESYERELGRARRQGCVEEQERQVRRELSLQPAHRPAASLGATTRIETPRSPASS
jgi:hypothetical protein